MEKTENSLQHRQVGVIRRNLLAVFRFAVKALIDKACFCSIDDGCEEFINFCATMEHILQHRLRPSKMWYLGDDRSHFWFYIKAACQRHDLQGCITNIDNIENIKSPVAKGRAFLRCALMEKRLSEYLGEALGQSNITRRYYKPGAIMLGEEATELCGVLLGLNSIDFGFCVKGENYDTVECPLAISYTPFMKFKQSQESLHSDLEEMKELSCSSSLASEDGQEALSAEAWPQRYNMLHKRYMAVLEQKSFLEEVTSSQEKALQTAAAAQQEVCLLQREAGVQKCQYEGVILELQAQVARMKSINESLKQELAIARKTRFPLTEMERKTERGGEAARFAAAMVHKQDSDRQSLTSSYDHGGLSRAGDTRSLTSAMSDVSMDTVSTTGLVGQSQASARRGDDTQSMVPLTGSLGDLHLDLDPAGVGRAKANAATASDISQTTVANPEQATPVMSVSTGAYTIAFLESSEINGNGKASNVHMRRDFALQDKESVQVSRHGEEDGDHSQKSSSGGVASLKVVSQTSSTVVNEKEKEQSSAAFAHHSMAVPTVPLPSTGCQQPSSHNDLQQGDHETVRKEVVMAEDSSLEAHHNKDPSSIQSSHSRQEVDADTNRPSHHSSNNGSEDSSQASEPEELGPEQGDVEEEGKESSTSTGEERDSSEDTAAEVLSQMTSSKESGSSDKDSSSEPELLAQEGEEQEKAKSSMQTSEEGNDIVKQESCAEATHHGVTWQPAQSSSSGQDKTSGQEEVTEGMSSASVGMTEADLKAADAEECGTGSKKSAEEKERACSGSDSGSSDENKEAWDMLSDANHDSNSS